MEEVPGSIQGRDNPQLLHVNAEAELGECKTRTFNDIPNIHLTINLSFYAIRPTILTAL